MTLNDSVPTCPDCGGILEPSPPGWAAAIEFASAALPGQAEDVRWQCLLCGFQPTTPADQSVGPGTDRRAS